MASLLLAIREYSAGTSSQLTGMTLVDTPHITLPVRGLAVDEYVGRSLDTGTRLRITVTSAFIAQSCCWLTHQSPPRLHQLPHYLEDLVGKDPVEDLPSNLRDLDEPEPTEPWQTS